MKETYYYGKLGRHQTEKILSTKDGRIVINTVEDAMVYGSTQRIYFKAYEMRDDITSYGLRLAELMKSEGRNRVATKLYVKTMEWAWRRYSAYQLYNTSLYRVDLVEPSEVYHAARLHLLEIGDFEGLKRLKNLHHKSREYAYLERSVECRYNDISRTNVIEAELERARFPF